MKTKKALFAIALAPSLMLVTLLVTLTVGDDDLTVANDDLTDAKISAALALADADGDDDLDGDDVSAFHACYSSPAKPRDETACSPAQAAAFDFDHDGDVDNDDFKVFGTQYDVVNPPHPGSGALTD